MTWPKNLPTYQPQKTPSRSDPRHLWQLRHLISSDDLTFRVFSNGAIMGTCDICDTDYNTDNWEPGLMTIFVTWQLIVTLDSIRNSCDVWTNVCHRSPSLGADSSKNTYVLIYVFYIFEKRPNKMRSRFPKVDLLWDFRGLAHSFAISWVNVVSNKAIL